MDILEGVLKERMLSSELGSSVRSVQEHRNRE